MTTGADDSVPWPDERVLWKMLYLPSLIFPLYNLQYPYRHCSKWWGLPILPPSDRSLRFGVSQYRRREVSGLRVYVYIG
jgi:hypothetical protein